MTTALETDTFKDINTIYNGNTKENIEIMESDDKGYLGKISLFCGIIIQLTLGLQYIVGNLIGYFASYMANKDDGTIESYEKYLNNLTYLYTAHTIFGNAFVIIGAKLEVKFKPRLTIIIGIIFTELGLFLSYFTITNYWGLLFTLGMISGIGIGIIYPIPMLVGMRWFPNHKGLVSGLIVAGYGFSGMIFNPLSTAIINPHNYPIDSEHGFLYTDEVLKNVPKLFIQMGLITSAMLIIGVSGLFSPKLNLKDEVKRHASGNTEEVYQKVFCKCIKIKDPELTLFRQCKFWNLIVTYVLGSMITTYIATQWKDIGNRWFGIENDRILSLMGLFGSLFNGLSRVTWGFIEDILKSYKKTMLSLFFILTTFMFTWIFLKYIENYNGLIACSFIWISVLFWNVTGQYGIFPSFFAHEWGNSDGMIAYGYAQFAGLVSPFIVTSYYLKLRDQWGWIAMNMGVCLINIIAIILIFFQKETPRDQRKQSLSEVELVNDDDIENE